MRSQTAYAPVALALTGVAAMADTQEIELPSGLVARLQEMLWDRPGGGLVYRFRFVASEFSSNDQDFEVTRKDLEHLCNAFALPKVSNIGPEPSQIVISLANKESEFGVIDPDIMQVFEAYSVQDGSCIWEVF